MPILRVLSMLVLVVAVIGCQQPPAAAPTAAPTPAEKAAPAAAPAKPTEKAAAAPKEMLRLRFGFVSKTALYTPMLISQEKNFFQQEGVEPEFITIPRSSDLIQQLGAGAIDMGQADAAQAIRAVQQGAPIKFVASGVNAALYWLMAQPDIQSAEQLRGKTIVVDGPTGQTKYMTEKLLEARGVQKGEYDFIYSGSTTDRFSQLRSGRVAAAILTIPINFQAQGEGFTLVGDIAEVLPDWSFNAVELNTNWAQGKEEVIVRYLRGLIRGADFLLEPGNRAEVIQILSTTTDVSEDVAEKTYNLLMDTEAYIPKLEPQQAAIERIMEYMVDVGDFQQAPPAEQYIERSYWQQATQGQ